MRPNWLLRDRIRIAWMRAKIEVAFLAVRYPLLADLVRIALQIAGAIIFLLSLIWILWLLGKAWALARQLGDEWYRCSEAAAWVGGRDASRGGSRGPLGMEE